MREISNDEIAAARDELSLMGCHGMVAECHRAAGWVIGGKIDQNSRKVVAAYIVARAGAKRICWLVTGPNAPRLGICCHSETKALRYQEKLGKNTHKITVGIGDKYSWSAL